MLLTIAINVMFHQPMYNFNESDGIVQLIVNFSNPSSTDTTVLIESNNITAYSKCCFYCAKSFNCSNFTGSIDYDSMPHNITVPAGDTNGEFNVTLKDDSIFELTETFSISLHVDATPLKISTDGGVVVVTIQDDDRKC